MLRTISIFLLLNMLADIFAPAVLAYTNSYNRITAGTANVPEMVDLKTGDLGYNVPVMEVPGPNGGYSIALSYKSGIANEQDASWVGLGWNCEVGAITRSVKGFADDYNGANVVTSGNLNSDTYEIWTPLSANNGLPNTTGTAYYGILNAYNATLPTADITLNRAMDVKALSDLSISFYDYFDTKKGDPSRMLGGAIPAYDQYSISGPGIGGAIEPVVLENGSLFGLKTSTRDYSIFKKFAKTKQQFRFKNEYSNSFTTTPTNMTTASGTNSLAFGTNGLGYSYKGPDDAGYNASTMRLAGAKHVNYFTNAEITALTAKTEGFINYAGTINRTNLSFTTREQTPVTFSSDVTAQVGGFSVTNEEGITYHYALPAYSYGETSRVSSGGNVKIVDNTRAYAYTWLLTSVTGPDFVDSNNNGLADEGDAGAWTNFNYGRVHHDYITRLPYTGSVKASDNADAFSASYKEVYYLDAVSTRSHTALFLKESRLDAAGAANLGTGGYNATQIDATYQNVGINYSKASMRLKSIHLYKNEDIIAMAASSAINPSSKNTFACIQAIKHISNQDGGNNLGLNIINQQDLYANTQSLLYPEKEIKRAVFNTDYSLSQGMPNSSSASTGRLTLKSVQYFGQMGTVEKPSIDFQYDLPSPQSSIITVTNMPGNSGWTEPRLGRIWLSNSPYQVGDIITFKNSNTQKQYHATLTRQLNANEYDIHFLGNNIPVGNPNASLSERIYLSDVIAKQTKNPPYTKDFRDNWGYFKSDYSYICGDVTYKIQTSGIENFDHRTNSISGKSVDVWSLRRITTNLGSVIDMEYEADTHSNKTDATCQGTKSRPKGILNVTEITAVSGELKLGIKESITGSEEFEIGQVVIMGSMITTPTGQSPPVPAYSTNAGFSWFKITGFGNLADGRDYVQVKLISTGYAYNSNHYEYASPYTTTGSGAGFNGAYIMYEPPQKFGGGVRTKKVSIRENTSGQFYETWYEYDGVNGFSSGMTATEPLNFAVFSPIIGPVYNPMYLMSTFRALASGFYNQLSCDYYNPGVLYENVRKRSYSNGFQKPSYEQYRFKVFSDDLIQKTTLATIGSTAKTLKVTDKTSQIGSLLSHKTIDLSGNVLSEEKYTYGDGSTNNRQGIIEQVFHQNRTGSAGLCGLVTVKSDYSSVLTKVETKDHVKGISTTVDYLAHDLYSGQAIKIATTDAYGNTVVKSDIPAYHIYTSKPSNGAEMGVRVNNTFNRNMLSQIAASYVSKPAGNTAITCSISSLSSATGVNSPKFLATLSGATLPGEYVVNSLISSMTFTIGGASATSPVYISSIASNRQSFEFYLPDSPVGIPIGSTATAPIGENPIVAASIQPWSNAWAYRTYNPSLGIYGVYENENIVENSPSSYYQYKKIWRQDARYIWNAPTTGADGTFTSYSDFNWVAQKAGTAQTNAYWQKQSTVVVKDNYSNSIEVKDINGNYAATKMANDQSLMIKNGTTFTYTDAVYNSKVVSTGKNTNLASFAFVGFEGLTKQGTNIQFSGEVPGVSGTSTASMQFKQTPGIKAHSGTYMLSLASGLNYTVFRSRHSTSTTEGNIIRGKKYRASVWVHNLSNSSASLSVYMDGSSTYTGSVVKSSSSVIVGDWTLLTLDFDVPANYVSTSIGNQIRVELNNASGATSYFDDFAVRPIDADMTSYVYDELTGAVLYTIDADNFYTRFQYDKTGRMIAAFKETLTGEKKISTYQYNFGKQ